MIEFNGKPLKLVYEWEDMEDLCAALTNRVTGLPESTIGIIERLGRLDPQVMRVTLLHGLRKHERKITGEAVQAAISTYVKHGGRPTDLTNAILEAFQESGLVYVRKEAAEDPAETK